MGSHFGRALSLFVLFSVRRIGGRLLRNIQIFTGREARDSRRGDSGFKVGPG